MPKAIHFINIRDGLSLKNLKREGAYWCAGDWDISDAEAQQLVGGFVYLHEAKGKKATFGGRVLEVRPVERRDLPHTRRWQLVFEPMPHAKSVEWRGASHAMASCSGLVDADLPQEKQT